MSIAGKVVDHGVKLRTRKLKGLDLAELDADRLLKGCEDPARPGQRQYAVTQVTMQLKHGGQVRYPGGLIVEDFVVHMTACLAAPEIHVSAETTICVPARLEKFSQAERKEWWRFYKDVERQEQAQVQRAHGLAEQLLEELKSLKVVLQSETVNEDKLREKALASLKQEAQAAFCAGQIDARLHEVLAEAARVAPVRHAPAAQVPAPA